MLDSILSLFGLVRKSKVNTAKKLLCEDYTSIQKQISANGSSTWYWFNHLRTINNAHKALS